MEKLLLSNSNIGKISANVKEKHGMPALQPRRVLRAADSLLADGPKSAYIERVAGPNRARDPYRPRGWSAMLPEKSAFTCKIRWLGKDNQDYDSFDRRHRISLPRGQEITAGGAHEVQDSSQTNPEELFAAAVASCMMMTILAVFSRSKIPVLAYEDEPEALLEFVERRYRVTKVTLRPRITLAGQHEHEKLDTLISKSHANCFIALSVKSEVVVEPAFVTAQA